MSTITQIQPSNPATKEKTYKGGYNGNCGKQGDFDDDQLLEGIRRRDNRILEHIYDQWFPMILDMVIRHSGSEDDARDIFQDAMVVIYSKIRNRNLTLYCTLKTFFYSVCKRLTLKLIQQKNRNYKIVGEVPEESDNSGEINDLSYEQEVEKYSIFKQHLLNLTDDARRLLNLYFENHSLKEICVIMGYKNESYVKSRKYNIKEDLKRRILNDPYYQNLYDACA